MVVADGAGTASRARLGSTLAVRAALSAVMHTCLRTGKVDGGNARSIVLRAFDCARKRLCREAAILGINPRELSCTLISVLANSEFVAAGQVGDGAVVVGDGASRLVALTTPTKGEFANQTTFLISNSTVNVATRSCGEIPVRFIAMFTDGLERLCLQFPSATPHPAFFRPLFEGLAQLPETEIEQAIAEFLNSPRIAARSDDDKTMLVAQLR